MCLVITIILYQKIRIAQKKNNKDFYDITSFRCKFDITPKQVTNVCNSPKFLTNPLSISHDKHHLLGGLWYAPHGTHTVRSLKFNWHLANYLYSGQSRSQGWRDVFIKTAQSAPTPWPLCSITGNYFKIGSQTIPFGFNLKVSRWGMRNIHN